MENPVHPDLPLEEDLNFEKREWRVERVAWVAMLLIALAGLAGLLGQGPLSRTRAGEAGSAFSVEYYRFDRANAESDLKLTLVPGKAENGEVRVWIDRTYLEGLTVQNIVPEPRETVVEADRTVFVFGATPGDRPATVRFHIEHDQWGRPKARAGLVGGPEVEFSQVVYP